MSDREKVINDLQRQIEDLEERLAIVLEGQPEIVRCADCAWYYNGLCVKSDDKDDWRFHDADWYCADGERK